MDKDSEEERVDVDSDMYLREKKKQGRPQRKEGSNSGTAEMFRFSARDSE